MRQPNIFILNSGQRPSIPDGSQNKHAPHQGILLLDKVQANANFTEKAEEAGSLVVVAIKWGRKIIRHLNA